LKARFSYEGIDWIYPYDVAQEATDPALIAAISGGAAVLGGLIGGGLGYVGVARQMKEQRKLEHLRYRRETYLDFLDAAQRFMRGSGVLGYSRKKWLEFFPQYEHKLNAVRLVGVPGVVAAAVEVQKRFLAMMEDIEYEDGTSGKEARQKALRKHEDEIRTALRGLRAAMRQDVGPA
jgi:hypothetical protein